MLIAMVGGRYLWNLFSFLFSLFDLNMTLMVVNMSIPIYLNVLQKKTIEATCCVRVIGI